MDVSLVLTHDCNLGCPYCYMGEKFRRDMPRSIAEPALELALSDQPARVQVSYFGGEPFLAFDRMREYTELAVTRIGPHVERLRFVVTTNGTCFTAERLRFLEDHDFFVGLSIDGTRDAHNAARPFVNGRGSFEAVRAGLRALLRSGIDFETISVVDPANVRHLGETVRFLLNTGVRRIALNPNFDGDWSDDDLALWEAGYGDVAQAYLDCYRRGHLVYINVIDDKVITHLKGGYSCADQCEFGKGAIAVAPSGNIYPCERMVAEDRDHSFCIGHVLDGFSPVRQSLISLQGNHNEDCQECVLKPRCMSWCPCANRADSGRIDEPAGLVCWHEQAAIAIADEVAGHLYREQNPMFLQNYYLR